MLNPSLIVLIAVLFIAPVWLVSHIVAYMFISGPVKIVHIPDGDGFNISHKGIVERIRIRHIDSPEYHQTYGKEARLALVKLLQSGKVRIARFGLCPYGRTLATVYVGWRRVDIAMVMSGNAWAYRTAWLTPVMYLARLKKVGMWSCSENRPLEPWIWRHNQNY